MVHEICRLLISLCLLALAAGLFMVGVKSVEPAQALGFGSVASLIIGALLTYWLKPG